MDSQWGCNTPIDGIAPVGADPPSVLSSDAVVKIQQEKSNQVVHRNAPSTKKQRPVRCQGSKQKASGQEATRTCHDCVIKFLGMIPEVNDSNKGVFSIYVSPKF